MKREIKIKEKQFFLNQNLKVLLKYEEISGKNAFSIEDNTTLTDTINLLYSMLIVNNSDFNYGKLEFVDIISEDDNILNDFSNFLIDLAKENNINAKKKQKK